MEITIIGTGLAGSEAALQLANRGIAVTLHDLKPHHRTAAHHNPDFAEIVCSNSFGSQGTATASGLLKLEMQALGSELIAMAQHLAVPAGKALAVDRDVFAREVTRRLSTHPKITLVQGDVTHLPESADWGIIATGPLTTPGLAAHLSALLEQQQLYFFDAAAPIITRDSIDMTRAFEQDRYGTEPGKTGEASYINCPLDKPDYERLVDWILQAEKTPLKSFEAESAQFFESCLPIEVLAARGRDTLRFGPMKPVGLVDPATGRRPYAAVQLRQDNAEGTLYNLVGFQTNLKWGPQGEMIRLIPGLENAEIVRYGVMHRNTYLHSPSCLVPTLQLKKRPNWFVAGQLTGTEGYSESIASGLFSALNIVRLVQGQSALTLPHETMLGALLHYITRPEAIGENFQPINSNWGILPPLPERIRDKATRNRCLAERAQASLEAFLHESNLFLAPLTLG